MSENKENVPKLRFPGFTDPWEQRKLGDFFTQYEDKVYLEDEEVYRQISVRNDGSVEYRGSKLGKEIGRKRQYRIDIANHPLTLTFTRQTVFEGGIGFIPEHLHGAIVTENMPLLDMRGLDKDFFVAEIHTNLYYQRVIEENTLIGSAQKALHEDLWLKTYLPFPSLPEQKVIGAFFEKLDSLITLHQRKLSHLQELKKGLLQKMFPKEGEAFPELRFPDFTDPWEQRKFSDLIDLRSGRDYQHLNDGTIPVYGTGGLITYVDEALSYKENAIGIGRKGTIDQPYKLQAPFWTVDTLFYAIPRNEVDLDFAYCSFLVVNWKSKDESTGLPSLSKSSINETRIAIPIFSEQEAIGRMFCQLDSLITLHQRKLSHLQELKKGLLQQMFV